MKIWGLLLVLSIQLFLPIAAEYPSDGPILTIVSGTVVQTLVLQTQVITSCPCNGTTITATGMASSLPILDESSDGARTRPGLVFGMMGFMLYWVGWLCFHDRG